MSQKISMNIYIKQKKKETQNAIICHIYRHIRSVAYHIINWNKLLQSILSSGSFGWSSSSQALVQSIRLQE